MCEELNQELQKGKQGAAMLAEHLYMISAEQCQIEVEFNGISYVCDIKMKTHSTGSVGITADKPITEHPDVQRLIMQTQKFQRAKELVYEKLDTSAHEGHKHYHGGCLFCDIEQVLKSQQ